MGGAQWVPGSGQGSELTPRHSSAPLTQLRPLLPSLLAGGTGLISIIFSRPYEFC